MAPGGEYDVVDGLDRDPDAIEMEVVRDPSTLAASGQVVVDGGAASSASDAVNNDIGQLTQPGGPLAPGGNPAPNVHYAQAPRRSRRRAPAVYDEASSALETPQERDLRLAREEGERWGREAERQANAENLRREAEAKRLADEAAKQEAAARAAQDAADRAAANKAKKLRILKILASIAGAVGLLGLVASPFLIWALVFGPGRRLVAGRQGLKTKSIDVTVSDLDEATEINVLLQNNDPVLVEAVYIFQNDGDPRVSEVKVPGVGTWSVNAKNNVVFTPVAPQTKAVTIQYVIRGVSGPAAPADSDPAKITINFNPTPAPVAIDIPFAALNRTADIEIDVPALSKNPDFKGDVKLVATDGTQLNSITDSTGGIWSVDGDTQHVKFALPASITVASVKVKYLLKLGLGISNVAEIKVTFPSTAAPPAANDIVKSPASTPPATRTGTVDFDIPAANANFSGSVSLIDSAGAKTASIPAKDQSGAVIGTWTVGATNHITFTPTGTVPDSVLSLTATYVLTGNADSNHATLTIAFPAGTAVPAAADIALTDCSRGRFTTFLVPGANMTLGAISSVDLAGGANPKQVSVNDPSTGMPAGSWVVLPDNTVQFQPVFPCRLDAVSVSYTLRTGNITTSAGKLTAAFTRKPEAFDCSGTSSNRFTPPKIDFLSFCIIPEGYQSFEFAGGGTNVTIPGTGRWFLETLAIGNPTANFTSDAQFTGASATIMYTVTDSKGVKSNPAALTARFVMPMARNFLVAKKVVAKELAAVDVLTENISLLPKDPSSVQLVGIQDLGQDTAAKTAFLRKDRKALQTPGEGVWLVDDNGLIAFQADDNFSGPPTPVMYRYADKNGNYSNEATIVMDPNLAAVDTFLTALGQQQDAVFWSNFKLHAITNLGIDELDSDEYITVTQTYAAGVRRLVSGALHNPVTEADYTAAFNSWVAAGQPNDGLIDTCATLVDAATKGVSKSLVNRYWRLTMMVRMLVQGNP